MNNKIAAKLAVAGAAFGKGFVTQIIEPSTIGFAVTAGVVQGLKYSGNFQRGIKTGLAVAGVFGTINGVMTIANNWELIRSAGEQQEV